MGVLVARRSPRGEWGGRPRDTLRPSQPAHNPAVFPERHRTRRRRRRAALGDVHVGAETDQVELSRDCARRLVLPGRAVQRNAADVANRLRPGGHDARGKPASAIRATRVDAVLVRNAREPNAGADGHGVPVHGQHHHRLAEPAIPDALSSVTDHETQLVVT